VPTTEEAILTSVSKIGPSETISFRGFFFSEA